MLRRLPNGNVCQARYPSVTDFDALALPGGNASRECARTASRFIDENQSRVELALFLLWFCIMQDRCPTPNPEIVPKRLHADSGLSFDPGLCLPLRHRGAGCEACAAACPAQAIMLGEREPEVSEACDGCGRCVPACPMGALRLPVLEAPVADTAPTRVDCRRVPRAGRSDVVVPCLGALDAAWLIERHAATGVGPELIDRGLCESCPSGGCKSPAGEAVEHARDLLESMGVPLSKLPRIVVEPLHGRPLDIDGAPVSRRDFLGRLARRSGAELARSVLPRQPVDPRLALPPHPSAARLRLLFACIGLARKAALPVPSLLFRSVRIDPACCDRGVCTSVCPSGALVREAPDDVPARLVFDAMQCIDCGACVRACPEKSLHLEERADEGWRVPEEIARFERHICTQCATPFSAHDGATECEPCARSRAMVRDFFRSLSATPPVAEHPATDEEHVLRDAASPRAHGGCKPEEESR